MEESIAVREPNEKKQRKLKSEVWDAFTRTEPAKDGKLLAICKICGAKFDGCSKKGTTHLRNHLLSKKCRDMRNGGNGDKSATPVIMEEKSSVIDLINQSFDEDGDPTKHWDLFISRKDEILQVYQEEKESFDEDRDPTKDWDLFISRKDKILQVYQEEKEKFGEFLGKFSCRFSLYIVSIADKLEPLGDKLGYNFPLRVQYIDDSWKRHSKIISILPDEKWIEETKELCSELKIDRNICCIILRDEQRTKIDQKEVIESWFSQRGSLPFSGFSLDFEGFRLKFLHFVFHKKWDNATAAFEHLEAFDEFLKSCENRSTTTITIKILDILKSFRFHKSEDCRVCKDASYKKLFDEAQVYLVVLILDPRLKMDIIQFLYEKIYGNDVDVYFENIKTYFRDIYNEYTKIYGSNDYKMMDVMGRPSTPSTKSELDLYLHDFKVPAVQEFDILAWWRDNAHFYPTLSRMARDYLAIYSESININSTLIGEIDFIWREFEFDNDILSALIYLKGLSYD